MTRFLLSLCFVAVFGSMSSVNAQVAKYEFTGTLLSSFGSNTYQFGGSIYGSVDLDLGTPPSSTYQYSSSSFAGESANWRSGQFTIDAMTAGGFLTGTTLEGGRTTGEIFDLTNYFTSTTGYRSGSLSNTFQYYNDGFFFAYREIQLYSYGYENSTGDGIASMSDWNPIADQYAYISVGDHNFLTNEHSVAFYRLDSFVPVSAGNIVIDGVDTGIADFDYNGSTISAQIEELGNAATNHGKFVSKVAKLLNELKKAGLISAEEKEILQEAAAESSIGK
ncbi:MAG: hypothetical protein KDA88_20590 [Planctomycetaceae bacterium]|nr:hypothetical protein [Planctomycetaceae bacterium]MCB9954164.1 hypothetical protein [Planctomycetaceae bacterium]